MDFEEDRPALTRDNEFVIRAWNFCGGWKPELIPFAAAYIGVRDVEFLTTQLLEMRGCFARAEEDKRADSDRAERQ